MSRILIALSVLICAFTATLQTPELHGGPMLACSGLPCVDVAVANGKHLRLLLDTGDFDSVLDTAVARQLGLALTPVPGRDGKPAPYQSAVLPGVKLGQASLGDVKVRVMDLSQFITQDRLPASDGTLAYSAFKDRLLTLDYRTHTLLFSAPLHAALTCPGYCGSLSTPTFGKQGPAILVATGFSVNGEPVTAQIDTLFSGTLLVYPTSVTKLRLDEADRTAKTEFFKYTDGGVHMRQAESRTQAFGNTVLANNAPLYFATPEVHLPDGMFDATVGHALLEHSVLSLDLHDMKVWMN